MLRRLLDRKGEMAELVAAWREAERGRPQLVVLWGRRRVGKTFLLSHFSRGKRCVFYGATEQAEAVELARLHDAVRRDLGDRAAELAAGGFSSWEAALRYFAATAKDDPLMVILDEAPYLTRSTPGFGSIVQVVWDHIRKGSRLCLVLTGSAIGTMEDLLGAGGPLRGRPTLARRLEPLDPIAARVFLPKLQPADYLQAYAACGGYPLHLLAWRPGQSVERNLQRLAFESGGLLLQDARSMLDEELSAGPGYARILAAVGRGHTRYGEIANEAGQRIEAPIDLLVRAGFLDKRLPVGAPKASRPSYAISDPYISFWFSSLYPYATEIEADQGPAVQKLVVPRWQRHMGEVFEALARVHAAHLVQTGDLPRDVVVGRWWSASGPQCEVDVLGLRGNRTLLLGEARWQTGKLGTRDLHMLERKLALVPQPVERPVFGFWSREGADSALKKQPHVLTFDLREMIER
jgi:AAA+ ATPase superfamily predicted ATPase